MGKKVLILTNSDRPELGHGKSRVSLFEDAGLETDIIYFQKRYDPETTNFILDFYHPLSLRFLLFAVIRFLTWITIDKSCKFWYRGISYPAGRIILKRIKTKPDYIVISLFRGFLSSRTIRMLYEKTGATLVFNVPDQTLFTGGCVYPDDCTLYEQGCVGCKGCPRMRWIPAQVMRQREKYLKDIPFHVAVTRQDWLMARKVPFLRGKEFHIAVTCPHVPFYKSKMEARKRFGITDGDYVILAGAANLEDKRKGIREMLCSLQLFAQTLTEDHPVTVLLLGNYNSRLVPDKRLKCITPGYVDMNDLYTAFYACDVFASPSLYDSGPMMVNYAIACGRPVVSFPVGVALDLVKHKHTGWMADFKDVDAFSHGLDYFYRLSSEELEQVEHNCNELMRHFARHPWFEFMLKDA